MQSASLVTTTSEETRAVVREMGARTTAVVFPDSYDYPIDIEKILAGRALQLDPVRSEIRLLWQGRPLWWKTPDLALMVLHRALERGLRVSLTMVGSWDNELGGRIKALAARLNITSRVALVPSMPRAEFLRLAAEHHAFLATSLHDSGGIPLIEAQAHGLPCLTLALGGTGILTKEDYLAKSVECIADWQANPATWLNQSEKALHFATQFTKSRLEAYVRDLVVPVFQGG